MITDYVSLSIACSESEFQRKEKETSRRGILITIYCRLHQSTSLPHLSLAQVYSDIYQMLESKDRDSQPEHSTPEEIQKKNKTNNDHLEVKKRTSKSPANRLRTLSLQKLCVTEHMTLVPPLFYAVICKIVILLWFDEDMVWFPLP